MNAYLEKSAQPAAARISDKNSPEEKKPKRFEGRKACAEGRRTEAAAAHSKDMARNEGPPAVPSDTRHERRAPRRTPARSAAQAESSRLNCARGVWRYAAGYWFL